MGGTNLVCEHGIIVGGCKCKNARSIRVRCPRADHAGLPVVKETVWDIMKKGLGK